MESKDITRAEITSLVEAINNPVSSKNNIPLSYDLELNKIGKRIIHVDPSNILTIPLAEPKDDFNYYVDSIDTDTMVLKNKWDTITIDINAYPELKTIKVGAKFDVKFG